MIAYGRTLIREPRRRLSSRMFSAGRSRIRYRDQRLWRFATRMGRAMLLPVERAHYGLLLPYQRTGTVRRGRESAEDDANRSPSRRCDPYGSGLGIAVGDAEAHDLGRRRARSTRRTRR